MEAGESGADLSGDSDHGGLHLVAGAVEGADLPARIRLHADPHREPSAVKEWVNTVAIIALFFLVATGALFLKAINDRELANQAAQAQMAVQWENFLRGFSAESNYDCTVLWYLNHADVNAPPPPPISVCHVAAP